MSADGIQEQALCISVTFLTGRYHGEEWPPSPARLYQALTAGLMTCGYRAHQSTVEPVLRWLEQQAPPRIRCTAAEKTSAYRIAVPNNDMDVVAKEWQQHRYKDPAALKTMKQIAPWRLPEAGPHVQYVWSETEGSQAPDLEKLRISAHLLHTLGWGVDMAYAELSTERNIGHLYEPAPTGTHLATPMPGTWEDLKAAHHRFQARSTGKGVDSFTRPLLFGSQPYRRAGQEYRPVARFRLMTPDGTKTKAIRWENCRDVAAWLRHQAGKSLSNEFPNEIVSGYIQGHPASDQIDKSRRISYVPLPTIYGQYGDGFIRRAMIVEPAGESGEVSNVIERKLTGAILTDIDGKDRCCLAPPEKADWTFSRYIPSNPCPVWRSVTPVVLHGYNAVQRGVISVAKTERLLLRAFAMAGIREEQIERLAFQAGPFWPGTKHSSAMRVPQHLEKFPRVHVEVRFSDQGVVGPVLAGIGRHYGIGLFAAVRSSRSQSDESLKQVSFSSKA